MDRRVSVSVGLLVLVAMGTGVTGQDCPSDYTRHGAWCFKEYVEGKFYNDARQVCAGDGGLLAMPKDSDVDNFLMNTLTNRMNHWIGLNDQNTEGEWRWEDGTPHDRNADYGRWRDGEPNGGRGENCVHDSTGWNDLNRNHDMPFICQLLTGVNECADGTDNCHEQATCTDTIGWFNCTCNVDYYGDGVTCTECPAGYTLHGNSCFKAYGERKSYDDARQVCADDGGLLAMPKDSDVDNFLVNTLRNPNAHYWIGLNDQNSERMWMWEDGTPHNTTGDYNRWHPGEPNHVNHDEDCAHYHYGEAAVWTDMSCSRSELFICQVDRDVGNPDHCDPNPCQNGGTCTEIGVMSYRCECPDGWSGHNCEIHCPPDYTPYAGSCFKVFWEKKPYDEARQWCADDGGLLALPKYRDVDDFLVNTMRKTNAHYWIGLNDQNTEGVWMWEDGTPHNTTGDYNRWLPGEPNNVNTGDDCAHYHYGEAAEWTDLSCSRSESFICQLLPATDPCDPDPCQNGGVCTSSGDSYTCECVDGWGGPDCQTDDDECAANTDNCHEQATCTNTDGGFDCNCNGGFTGNGVTCTDVDECAADTDNCHEQATCTNTDGGFECNCDGGYTGNGVTCTDVDECAANTDNCHEQATCTNTDGGFDCNCDEGYTGNGVTCTGLSDFIFTDIGMDYMTLSWTVPAGLNVTRYRLRYRHAGASYRDLSPPPGPGDTTATVPGLWADTEYTFTLTAFGGNDEEIGEISGTETTAEVIVNVECHEDYMTVTFPRAALPAVDVDNMHLLDDSCRATVTQTEVTLRAGLQDCGTIQDSSEDDKFIFTNEAIASQVTSDNGAVRGTPFSKRFQCEFLRQYVVSQGRDILYNIPSPRVQVVDAENSFTFEMHMFTSADFTATYNSPDYPVQVTSSDNLHFGLSVNSPLNNLELFALHCLATPSTDPGDSPSVSIIQDGCDIDTTLQLDTTLSNDMALYYSIQSFTFPNIDDPSLVYIHCTMVVCFKDDPDSRCSQGCVSSRRRRRAVSDMSEARVRRASERDHITTVSQGPFAVESGQGQGEASTIPTVGIAVGTAAGIAGVLLLVVAVFLVRKRRGRDVKEQAEDRVGFDNYSLEIWGKDKAGNATAKPE
ncbi:uncharacterized protein LOC118409788 [Branchiostoma floridae]|uniref:Uncharacterized protein LOC118409788 n=1 Tax=Branchiostoma floridae TaxID=7739 RepID=A0A9J7MGJ8_BRAFL|nr:uncharacterized protein LOC118409788 [Branchiostoma floridae]